MSRQMIEVVQRACQAWGTGDLEVLYELYTPDVTADGGRLWFEHRGVISGADAVVGGFAALIGAFDRNELLPEGAIEAGDTLIVPLLWRGLPPGGTSFVEQRLIGSFSFSDDGRISSMTWFGVLGEALDAADLPPSAADKMIVLRRATEQEQS